MSEQNEQDKSEHLQFTNEAAMHQERRFAISRILKACPVQHDPAYTREMVVDSLLQEIEQTHDLHVSDGDSKWVKAKTRTGADADLKALVEDAFLRSSFVDPVSKTEAVKSGAVGVKAKSDLTSVQQKVAYIDKFGEDAYAKLPLNRERGLPSNYADWNRQQWLSVSPSERSRMAATFGKDAERLTYEIMRRK